MGRPTIVPRSGEQVALLRRGRVRSQVRHRQGRRRRQSGHEGAAGGAFGGRSSIAAARYPPIEDEAGPAGTLQPDHSLNPHSAAPGPPSAKSAEDEPASTATGSAAAAAQPSAHTDLQARCSHREREVNKSKRAARRWRERQQHEHTGGSGSRVGIVTGMPTSTCGRAWTGSSSSNTSTRGSNMKDTMGRRMYKRGGAGGDSSIATTCRPPLLTEHLGRLLTTSGAHRSEHRSSEQHLDSTGPHARLRSNHHMSRLW